MRARYLSILLLLTAARLALGQAATWDIAPDGRAVTVTTKTLRATFRDGTLIALQNKTGGDSLLVATPASQAAPALKDAQGASSADATTKVACTRQGDGARITLSGLAGDPTALITLDLGAEADGTLTVQQSGGREKPRLLSGSWGLAGVDAAKTLILLPWNGGALLDPVRGPGTLHLDWPTQWQAAIIALQGKTGGFSVWAEDPEAQFKSVEVRRFGGEVTLTFGSETRAAYDTARRLASPVWRIQAYRGPWQVPALAYRQRLARARGLAAIANRTPDWIKDIRAVVRVGTDAKIEDLRGLAAHVDPHQTLLYVPGWRKHPYDNLYPDYDPKAGFVEWCHAAQAMGFRVMPHGNMVGINLTHSEFAQVEKYAQTDRISGDRVGWFLDKPGNPCQVLCLNPASAEVRKFLIAHFKQAYDQVHFDALHLDFPVITSTHDGDRAGLTCARGAEVYLQELQAALPDVVLGTEGLNETLLACSFAQVAEPFWVSPAPGVRPHPIRSTIFAPFCGLYGHLGMPSQQDSFPAFLSHHDFLDWMGAWPTMSLDGPFDPASAGNDFVLREANYFQHNGLTPVPEAVNYPDELFAWRGRDGAISAIFDNPPGRRLAARATADKPAWALLEKVNTYDGPGTVTDWRAFDGHRLFGLDPGRRYPLVPTVLDPKALHLVSASQPIIVQEVRDNPRRALFRFGGQTAIVADLVELAGNAATGILVAGQQQPLSAGATFSTSLTESGGEALPAIGAHPPAVAQGGITYGDYVLTVPAKGKTVLRFATGLRDLPTPELVAQDNQKPLSDGVTFIVSVNQQELFREHWLRGKWARRQVDISPFSGNTVTLRLTTSPGPNNDANWDWAVWGQPQVVNLSASETQPIKLRVLSPYVGGAACFGDPAQPGRVAATQPAAGGVLLDIELPRLQPFGFVYEARPAAAGAQLADLPFIIGQSFGGLLREGSYVGSGSVGTADIAGAQLKTIGGHPPDNGRTVLEWCVQLPPEPLQLKFFARVVEGGRPVAFEVQVNGQPAWSLPMPVPSGWKPGTVNLSPWAGKPVLISLVTDSLGSNVCCWGQWGDVRLAAP